MSETFYERPVLNRPYEYPGRHWKLENGVPTDLIIDQRRQSEYIVPVPKPRRQRGKSAQETMELGVQGLSTQEQKYDPTPIINEIRRRVDMWRALPTPNNWGVTPVTARLLQHWRGTNHEFLGLRPFFCQVEAVETVIWLTEVTGILGAERRRLPPELGNIREHLEGANREANPDLLRIALKLATGAGKTTVMAMLIAWQAANAARSPGSRQFTNSFLVVAPGITIRDRLRVLLPNDPENYYEHRDLVPRDMVGAVKSARVVVTNYHAFKLRERESIAKGTRELLAGRTGKSPDTVESEGQMLRRVMPELVGRGRQVFVMNDEGHHCYRERAGETEEGDYTGDERDEAKRNNEAARLWIKGVETVRRKVGTLLNVDLSATPFFLRGSGYVEGTLFPWTVSDFSLMDAIECGIVKVPRVPVSENLARANDAPIWRNLWEHIGKKMPRKGRQSAESLDPLALPTELQSALEALYDHYSAVYEQWNAAGIVEDPVFIIVCNNTATSKLLYEHIAGCERPPAPDGAPRPPHLGRYELFRNYGPDGARLASPRTLLIDSEQLESGDALVPDFRKLSAEAIELFKRERAQRQGAGGLNEDVSDADLLREAMNTVGKPGRLGAGIRCVVSVSMLTEGWDANTVTHILGVRAFGTQLLCEQVVGRALRRQSYEADEDGLLPAEYADVLGVPFDFTAKPAVVRPNPPADVVRVRAVSPERDALAIHFPRVTGYRAVIPDDRLDAVFDADSRVALTPEVVGPTIVQNEGIVGQGVTLTPQYLDDVRSQTIAYHLAKHLMERHFRERDEPPKAHLFHQLRAITGRWLAEGYLECYGGALPAQLLYREVANNAVERIYAAIAAAAHNAAPGGEPVVKASLDPFNPVGSTRHVNFTTSKKLRWRTEKSHLNFAICDSEMELQFCNEAEKDPRVLAYVKNHGIGFEVPYRLGDTQKIYIPDFIVLLDDGKGWDDPLHLVVETKGYRRFDVPDKSNAMNAFWIPGVNALVEFGRWAFIELSDVYEMREALDRFAPAGA